MVTTAPAASLQRSQVLVAASVTHALSFYMLLSSAVSRCRAATFQTRANEVVYCIHQNGIEQTLLTLVCCACVAGWLEERSVVSAANPPNTLLP